MWAGAEQGGQQRFGVPFATCELLFASCNLVITPCIVFQKRQPVCGRLRPKQQVFLFGENSAMVKSAVLIPLYEARAIGVLAMGSNNPDRFHPGMGTMFLTQLGELVSRALSLHLDHTVHSVESSGSSS